MRIPRSFGSLARVGGVTLAVILARTAWGATATNAPTPAPHWSYRPLSAPRVPAGSASHASASSAAARAHPIDAFIQDRLDREGIPPSPEADRRTLLRRVSLDLTGLPPTPAEMKAFEEDAAPGAYERCVDRLLASPRYGERWARHWLDVVHYGETHGYDTDQPRPNAGP